MYAILATFLFAALVTIDLFAAQDLQVTRHVCAAVRLLVRPASIGDNAIFSRIQFVFNVCVIRLSFQQSSHSLSSGFMATAQEGACPDIGKIQM